jgi:TatD DNase family protein
MPIMSERNLTDTHAHMADTRFDSDLDSVLERAREAGVVSIVCVSETFTDASRVLELSETHPMLRPAMGLYPGVLEIQQAESIIGLIRRNREKLVAIGEIGLDRWIVKEEADREIQEVIFRRFIDLARATDLPLNVHSRSAGRQVISTLLDCGAERVQLHAFDGKASTALPAVEAGYFFSVPPSILRSRQKQKLIRALPLEALLLESDSPVLGPNPQQRNEPANIIHSLRSIAEIKGISEQEAVEVISDNCRRLYGLPRS